MTLPKAEVAPERRKYETSAQTIHALQNDGHVKSWGLLLCVGGWGGGVGLARFDESVGIQKKQELI